MHYLTKDFSCSGMGKCPYDNVCAFFLKREFHKIMKKQIDKEILLINWGYVGPIRVNNGKLPSIKIMN